MNELLLIDMMGELSPALLQDNYMEKDLRRGKLPFLKQVFFLKKSLKNDDILISSPLSQEYENSGYEIGEEFDTAEDKEDCDQIKKLEESNMESKDSGLRVSIFEKKTNPLYGILSGVAATTIVVSGIVVYVVKRHKAILD